MDNYATIFKETLLALDKAIEASPWAMGLVTGARTQIDQGKMVYVFALSSKMLYDYINWNLTHATYSEAI